MIQIDRDRLGEKGELIRPNQAWFDRAAVATATAERERAAHAVKRTIYAHDQVRAALRELFHDKCAYCEAELRNVQWDMEHYRPKKAVSESPTPRYVFCMVGSLRRVSAELVL